PRPPWRFRRSHWQPPSARPCRDTCSCPRHEAPAPHVHRLKPRSAPLRDRTLRLPKSRPPRRSDFRASPAPAGRALSQSSWTFLVVSPAHGEPHIVQEDLTRPSARAATYNSPEQDASTGGTMTSSATAPASLVIRRAAAADIDACANICYQAFSTINAEHN